jgi:hypothetical protein
MRHIRGEIQIQQYEIRLHLPDCADGSRPIHRGDYIIAMRPQFHGHRFEEDDAIIDD